ncbi:MAG: hypothetical protein AAGH71_01990 [Planctomycetota bacterium]
MSEHDPWREDENERALADLQRELSSEQRAEQAERLAVVADFDGRPPRRRSRVWLARLSIAGLALLLLAAVLPTVAGPLAKPWLESRLSEAMGTPVRIGSLKLSWLGSQHVRDLRIADETLREVVDLDAETDRSLADLLGGPLDLGRVRLSGRAELAQRDDGSFAPFPASSGDDAGPVTLPEGLRGTLLLDGVDLAVTDVLGRTVLGEALTGEIGADFASGGSLVASIAGEVGTRDEVRTRTGGVSLTLSASSFVDGAGVLAVAGASIDTVFEASALPASAFEPWLGRLGRVGDAPGGAVTLAAQASGSTERGSVTLSASAGGESASLEATYVRADGGYDVGLAGPARVSLTGGTLSRLAPRFASLTDEGVTTQSGQRFVLDAVPGVVIEVARLSVVADPGDLAGSLESVSMDARLATTPMAGMLDGDPWSIEGLVLGAETRRLGDGVRVEGSTTAMLAGETAGVLALVAEGLEPSALLTVGGSRPWQDRLAEVLAGGRVSVELTDVRTAVVGPLLSPWLVGTGIAPVRDFGPTVSAEVDLTADPVPALLAAVDSARLTGRAGLRLEGDRIVTDGLGVRVEAVSAAPYLTSLLADAGVAIESGASVRATLRDASLRLAGAVRPVSEVLGGFAGLLDVEVGEVVVLVDRGPAGGDGQEAPVQRVRIEPSSARVDVRDLSSGASLSYSARTTLNGLPAGELVVSLRAEDLLDASGVLRAGVPGVQGEVGVRSLRASLLEPWLDERSVEWLRVAGDTVTAVAIGERSADGVVAVTSRIRGDGLTGDGSLVIDEGAVRLAGEGFRLELADASSVLPILLPAFRAQGDGGRAVLVLTAGGFGALPAGEARGVTGWLEWTDLAWIGASGDRLVVDRANVSGAWSGRHVTLELNTAATYADQPVLLAGRLMLPGLFDEAGGLTPFDVAIDGRLDLTGVPVDAVGALTDLRDDDPRPLIRDFVGSTLDAALVAEGGDVALTLSGANGTLEGELALVVGRGRLAVGGGTLGIEVDQASLEQARLAAIAQGRVDGVPGAELISPASLLVRLDPFVLADAGVFGPSGSPRLTVEADGVVRGLTVGEEPDVAGIAQPVRSGAIGVEGLSIASTLPIEAWLGGGEAQLSATIDGVLVGEASQPIARIEGRAEAGLVGRAPQGPIGVSVTLGEADLGGFDESLRTGGVLSAALGASGEATVALAGEASGGRVVDASLDVLVRSSRLETSSPLRLAIGEDRVALEAPAVFDWTLDPRFGTGTLLGQPVGAEWVRLVEPAVATVRLESLTVSRPEADGVGGVGGVALAGVFDLGLSAEVPSLVFEHAAEVPHDGAQVAADAWRRTVFAPVRFEVRSEGGAALRLTADAPIAGAEDEVDPGSTRVDMLLEGFADDVGHVQLRGATLTGRIESRRTPTALLDGTGRFDGWLAEVVGPVSNSLLTAESFSVDSGSLAVSLTGDRASARLAGDVVDGVFTASEPLTAEIGQIRTELGRRISGAVPVLGSVTKRVEDGPATLTIENMSFPLGEGGPIAGLGGDFTLDVGTARFTTGRLFSRLLTLAGQRTEGEIGRRVDPMVGTVRDGRLAYERFTIPLGEFTIMSEGSYNLDSGFVSVTTYVPIGALTEEALGILSTGLGSRLGRLLPGLERATMIPWKVSGPRGAVRVQPDYEALTRDLVKLLNPVTLIEGVLGGIRRGVGGG